MLKKEKISELEDLVMEAIQYETQEKKKRSEINEECISESWDYLKQSNIQTIGTLRKERGVMIRRLL